jgi:hypothetical protein
VGYDDRTICVFQGKLKVTIKVKLALEQVTKIQRVSRGIALIFL